MSADPTIAELFERCGKLRSGLFTIEEGVEEIREISMNTSVAVCHTGVNVHAFNEIAGQISRVATRMSGSLRQARLAINEMINLTLQAFILEKRREKFEEAAPFIQREANRALFERVLTQWNDQTVHIMLDVFPLAHRTSSLLQRVRHHLYLLFAAVNALKVESTDLAEEAEAVIVSLTEQLKNIQERESGKLDASFELLRHINRHVHAIVLTANDVKETPDAQAHAV